MYYQPGAGISSGSGQQTILAIKTPSQLVFLFDATAGKGTQPGL
jgi:hypothetical protein